MLEVAPFIAGFAAAEGTFLHARQGERSIFTFAVALGVTDTSSVELLHAFFGCGTIQRAPRRQQHYDDEVRFQVRKLADLVEVIVPFMDEHLPPSHKRVQYEAWRAELVDWWAHGARRRRPCTEDGCDEPHSARGLCRRHYHRAYGR